MKHTRSIFIFSLIIWTSSLFAQDAAYHKLKSISEETDRQLRFDAISNLIAEYPTYPLAYHEKGQAYYKANLYDSALVYFQKALSFPDPKPAYHHALGNCLNKLGKEQAALEQYEMALKLDPLYYPVILDRSQYYMAKQLNTELQESIEILMEWEEEMGILYFMRGNLKMQKADRVGMQADMKKVITLGPKQMEVYDRLARWTEAQGMLNYPEERLEWKEMNLQLAQAASLLANMPNEVLNVMEDRNENPNADSFGPYNEALTGKKVSDLKIKRLNYVALDLFREGKLKQSLTEFEKVLHYYPQHKEALKYQKEIKALLEIE